MNKNYKKLMRTLRRLFEIDRADLDFGFYRIMHAKAEQVQEFIEKDLLLTVKDAFGAQSSQNSQELLDKARQKVIQTLGEDAIDTDGNVNPAFATIPAGKQYQEEVSKILQQKVDGSSETDIYDHLCRFFERYYEGGDFVSRRYYAKETSGKAAPYAIPYNGEEVKLHWANADQYYIKTTENYNNFTFDLRQAREVQAAPRTFKAIFKRNPDPELPEDQHTKLVVDGKIRQDASGPGWFRKIEGWLPQNPASPNNGKKEKILIVWRKLTNDLEKDNVVLDEWFQKNRISTQDFEFDTIYVNGSNNLPNLQKEGDIWKVRLIEEEFMKKMWEVN